MVSIFPTIRRLSLVVVAAAIAAAAAVTVAPTTATSGLSWSPPPLGCGALRANSACYTPVALVASGGSGTYTWTIKDSNGGTLATITSGGGNATSTFGSLDCTGSADNSHCNFSAPGEYPSGPFVTATATSGTSATFTMTFDYSSLPAAYMQERARTLGMNNMPWTLWSDGGNPPTYQSTSVLFPNLTLPGTWIQFSAMSGTSFGFPSTAGSSISRPAASWDGRRFIAASSQCHPSFFCSAGDEDRWVWNMDGSGVQVVIQPQAEGVTYTWDPYRPSWLVDAWTPGGSTQNIGITDVANGQASVIAASFSDSISVHLFSQADRTHLYPVQEANFATGCLPDGTAADCNAGGVGPNVFTYDLSACDGAAGAPSANCGTLAATVNLNQVILSGFNASGVAHSVGEEYHVHDIYQKRGSPTTLIANYGPNGDVGEFIFFEIPYNAAPKSGEATPLYPQQPTTANVPYLVHPAFLASGNVVAAGGSPYCAYAGEPSPGQNQCTSSGAYGAAFEDMSATGSCSYSVALTSPTSAACSLLQFGSASNVGHYAGDGFRIGSLGHDNAGLDVYDGMQYELFWESNWSRAYETETLIYPFGSRPLDTSGDSAMQFLYGPTQSPDATKYAIDTPDSMTVGNIDLPWMFQVRSPEAPGLLTLASTAAATINWYAAPLNHEAERYWVWKQSGCAGAWTRLAAVDAVYLQTGPYSYTDTTLTSGSACYGITAQEWSGEDSELMSAQIGITDAGGTYSVTSRRPAGTAAFHATPPNSVTALAASQALVCATGCGQVGAPSAPTLSTGSGGSLAAGTYSVKVSYFKWADFPANTAAEETLPSPAAATTVAAGGTLTVSTSSSEMVGQDGARIYIEAPGEGSYTLRSTVTIPDYANGAGSNFASQAVVTYSSMPAAGANPSGTNAAVGGYRLSWNLPVDNDLRAVLVFYREGAVPTNANPWQYEISAQPATATGFYDAFPNQEPSGAIYYMVKTMDMDGNLSAGACYEVGVGAVGCN